MRLYRERLYTEEELGNLEQREYGLLRRVKATVGRARRNVAKKLEEKIDKNLVENGDAIARAGDLLSQKAPKGTYKAQNQVFREVRREQPNVQFTNKKRRDYGSGPYYTNRSYPGAEKLYFKPAKIPKYADHVIFTGSKPNIGATLHEVGHMRRASGKEGVIANFVSKKSVPKEYDPFTQIKISGGDGSRFEKSDAINRGVSIKDAAHYASRWLEERGANKYADRELKRLLKEGKITEEMYNKGREMTKVSMETYTPATKVNILSSLKNTIDIPSRRGRFDLKNAR